MLSLERNEKKINWQRYSCKSSVRYLQFWVEKEGKKKEMKGRRKKETKSDHLTHFSKKRKSCLLFKKENRACFYLVNVPPPFRMKSRSAKIKFFFSFNCLGKSSKCHKIIFLETEESKEFHKRELLEKNC